MTEIIRDLPSEKEFTRRLMESRMDRANGMSKSDIKAKYFTYEFSESSITAQLRRGY